MTNQFLDEPARAPAPAGARAAVRRLVEQLQGLDTRIDELCAYVGEPGDESAAVQRIVDQLRGLDARIDEFCACLPAPDDQDETQMRRDFDLCHASPGVIC